MPDKPLQRGFFSMAWYNSAKAIALARAINKEIREARPLTKCRGINKVSHDRRWVGTGMEYEDSPLGFLENVPCPSVIIETGYLTSPIDSNWLREQGNRYVLGRAIGQGILNYLEDQDGLERKA
jgi:N-acetylmuramoyl-L-alanine amidase